MAKQIRLQGSVTVQVLIDENGESHFSEGCLRSTHCSFREAQRAALQARFSPTKLSDQPVKVSGVITYNFVLLDIDPTPQRGTEVDRFRTSPATRILSHEKAQST